MIKLLKKTVHILQISKFFKHTTRHKIFNMNSRIYDLFYKEAAL